MKNVHVFVAGQVYFGLFLHPFCPSSVRRWVRRLPLSPSLSPPLFLDHPDYVSTGLLQVPLVSGEDSVAVLFGTRAHEVQMPDLKQKERQSSSVRITRQNIKREVQGLLKASVFSTY